MSRLEKASRWYAARGLIEEAIETALAAQDFDRAAELIEQAIEHERGVSEQYTLGRWAAQLPEAVLHAHPLVCFSYALVVLFTSDRYAPATMTRVAQLLQVAETAWRAAYDDAHLGQALALRGTAALWQGDLTLALRLRARSAGTAACARCLLAWRQPVERRDGRSAEWPHRHRARIIHRDARPVRRSAEHSRRAGRHLLAG